VSVLSNDKIENWYIYICAARSYLKKVTGELYLNILGNKLLPEIRIKREDMLISQWSMEHGSVLHYAIPVRLWI
jgi:hypothetical protein